MPPEIGQHKSGEIFARVHIDADRSSGFVEGRGEAVDAAIEDLMYRLRSLSQWAEEAADAIDIDQQ